METIETYRVIEGERSLTFTNKFDALRWAVRSEGMTELSLWHHTGERLANGFAYKGEDSLKMVESVTLYELADHPWLTLHPETWVELYSVVAEDLARADGVTLEAWVCPNGDTHYTDKGQDAFEEFVTQAEQLMTDSGLTKGEY
jgi:hypothetical protein|tara:strand:+ start:637 stop:1068 length:432 start_codon:yes stop_codon:yes gene_type:complete